MCQKKKENPQKKTETQTKKVVAMPVGPLVVVEASPVARVDDARRKRSEKYLKERGITKIPDWLPPGHTSGEISLKSQEQVIHRVVIMLTVYNVKVGNKTAKAAIDSLKKQWKIWDEVTPNEKEYLATLDQEKAFGAQEVIEWRSEKILVLWWALHIWDDLGIVEECWQMQEHKYFKPLSGAKNVEDFIKIAQSVTKNPKAGTLRTKDEILDEADIIYCMHWVWRQASLFGTNGIGPGISEEWHGAIDWLYTDQNFDNMDTST